MDAAVAFTVRRIMLLLILIVIIGIVIIVILILILLLTLVISNCASCSLSGVTCNICVHGAASSSDVTCAQKGTTGRPYHMHDY